MPTFLRIADNGEVVGYRQSDDDRTPLHYSDGAWKPIDGVASGVAMAIDNQGHIVGYEQDTGTHAFTWTGGTKTTLPVPADRISAAYATNGSAACGSLHAPSGATHAFVTRDGSMTDLGTLGGANSSALAINEKGDVAGTAQTAAGSPHGFVALYGTPIVDVGAPFGGTSSDARGIDSQGRVAANSDVGAVSRPFVFVADRAPVDILPKDANGVLFASAHVASMSANGKIAGWGVPHGGTSAQVHCIMWTLKNLSFQSADAGEADQVGCRNNRSHRRQSKTRHQLRALSHRRIRGRGDLHGFSPRQHSEGGAVRVIPVNGTTQVTKGLKTIEMEANGGEFACTDTKACGVTKYTAFIVPVFSNATEYVATLSGYGYPACNRTVKWEGQPKPDGGDCNFPVSYHPHTSAGPTNQWAVWIGFGGPLSSKCKSSDHAQAVSARSIRELLRGTHSGSS